MERGQVALEAALSADDQQPRARVEHRVIGVKEADDVFDLLVRDHSPHKQDVRPLVVELPGEQPVRRPIEMREIRHNGQDRRPRESQRLEILAIELRVAHRQVAAIRVGAELAPAAETLARQRPVDPDEIFGRRNVVVDERHPIGQRVRGPGGLRPSEKWWSSRLSGWL